MDRIILSGMTFHAHHGVMEEERLLGNTFVVDLEASLDLSAPAASDSLEDTVNYAEIYALVAREMAVPSKLLEHVAGRIIDAVKSSFPSIVTVKVTVSKKNPPVLGVFPANEKEAPESGAPCEWSRIELTR
ncbi:MAG: dihydroneopterin aldolase [Bacteroidales bacterium]|nr:dihydroneopterin aldolase [Bacteroidales bacterium]